MAHLLGVAFSGDLSASRIAAELSCSPAIGIRLALMMVPRKERDLFRQDVASLAEATGIDRPRLLAVIRQAQSLIAFQAGAERDNTGMLLAARDVVPGSEDQER
jgi:hypothetical protein